MWAQVLLPAEAHARREADASGVKVHSRIRLADRSISRPGREVIRSKFFTGTAYQHNGTGIPKESFPGVGVQLLQHRQALHDDDYLTATAGSEADRTLHCGQSAKRV